MISIPNINSAIPNIKDTRKDTKIVPKRGDAIINPDKAIAITPAPMLNPLVQPRLCLSTTPRIIRAIPTNSKAIANKIITNTAVWTGYPTAIEPKMRDRTPSPTVPHRDLFAPNPNIPVIISNIPRTIKVIPSMYIIENSVIPGCTITNIDNMMAMAPRPICTARIQPGDLDLFIDILR